MKYIFLNLKRFDILPDSGGVNSLASPSDWGRFIVSTMERELSGRADLTDSYAFPIFFPEAHIITAVQAKDPAATPSVDIGCQGVHHADTAKGGAFGAFTSLRTANSMRQLGCSWVIIGHSEERRYMTGLMSLAGADAEKAFLAVQDLLHKEIACALASGLRVLYCIGEDAGQTGQREAVLRSQLNLGLDGLDTSRIVLAYEPIWAIGPGRVPPTSGQIAQTAALVKSLSSCPLVYGGGLKKENAEAIGRIPDLDGGLIALTRFHGEIGFHPSEYREIVDLFTKGAIA